MPDKQPPKERLEKSQRETRDRLSEGASESVRAGWNVSRTQPTPKTKPGSDKPKK